MHRILIVAVAVLAMALTGSTALGQKPPKNPKPNPQQPQPSPYTAGITISPSANPVVYPSGVTFTGRVNGAKAGVTVTLQSSILRDGPYKNLAETKTDNSGKYSVGDRPSRNLYYRVVSSAPNPAQAGIYVRNAMRVGLIVSDSTPRRGALITFRGTVRPRHDGRTVYVQRRSATGRWVTLKRPRLVGVNSTTSKYRTRIRVRSNGTYRARVLGHADHSLGTSRSRTLVVH